MSTIDLTNINPGVVLAIVTFMVVGSTEWIKAIWRAVSGAIQHSANWQDEAEKAAIITIAALAGMLVLPIFGNYFTGLTPGQISVIGMLLGFNASGVVTIAFNWGKTANASTAVPVNGQTTSDTDTLG